MKYIFNRENIYLIIFRISCINHKIIILDISLLNSKTCKIHLFPEH